jgi:hypothetical protein
LGQLYSFGLCLKTISLVTFGDRKMLFANLSAAKAIFAGGLLIYGASSLMPETELASRARHYLTASGHGLVPPQTGQLPETATERAARDFTRFTARLPQTHTRKVGGHAAQWERTPSPPSKSCIVWDCDSGVNIQTWEQHRGYRNRAVGGYGAECQVWAQCY